MIEDELLRAVIESPDDDGPRLVDADALIQAGDPRGELIANHVAGVAPAELATAWQQTLGDTVTELMFERGFPTTLCIATCSFTMKVTTTVAMTTAIRYTPRSGSNAIRGRRGFARSISPAVNSAGASARFECCSSPICDRSAHSKSATKTRARTPSKRSSPARRSRSRSSDSTAATTRNGDLSDGLPLLAASPRVATLRELAITKCSLEPSADAEIARSPHFASLVALDLTGGDYVSTQQLADEGLGSLARSAHLGKLERLELAGNELTDAGVVALARSPTLARVVERFGAESMKGSYA